MISKIFYPNIEENKLLICKENNKKSGIYKLTNSITGKFYIGSATNLTKRLNKYFTSYSLKRTLLRSKTIMKLKLSSKSCSIVVTNMNDLSKKEYSSVSATAKNLNVCVKTIYNYANKNKLLKNIYLINK